jgi:hypothetical protein
MSPDRAYLKGARSGPGLRRLQAEVARVMAVLGRDAELVEPAALLPADTLLDLYGEDIRARAFVTRDDAGERMLRPDFTVPIVQMHMAQGAQPRPMPIAGRSGGGRRPARTGRWNICRPGSSCSTEAIRPRRMWRPSRGSPRRWRGRRFRSRPGTWGSSLQRSTRWTRPRCASVRCGGMSGGRMPFTGCCCGSGRSMGRRRRRGPRCWPTGARGFWPIGSPRRALRSGCAAPTRSARGSSGWPRKQPRRR